MNRLYKSPRSERSQQNRNAALFTTRRICCDLYSESRQRSPDSAASRNKTIAIAKAPNVLKGADPENAGKFPAMLVERAPPSSSQQPTRYPDAEES